MKPGDLIEWIYAVGDEPLDRNDMMLWSTVERKYVSVGTCALLISVNGSTYTWLSNGRICRAHMGDCALYYGDEIDTGYDIFPRKFNI